MATRDALATPQPYGLPQGFVEALVPLPSESENPQPAGPVAQIGQPLGHPVSPSPSDRIHVYDNHGAIRQSPELLDARRHYVLIRLPGGRVLWSNHKLLLIPVD